MTSRTSGGSGGREPAGADADADADAADAAAAVNARVARMDGTARGKVAGQGEDGAAFVAGLRAAAG